jgi:hypothetical protein
MELAPLAEAGVVQFREVGFLRNEKGLMKYLLFFFLLCFCAARAVGQDFVQPSPERISPVPYWTAVGVAAGFTAADAATTLVMVQPHNRCNAEVGSPLLFGREPKPARTIAVMAVTTMGAALLSRKLRKEGRWGLRRLWWSPLAVAAIMHADGTFNNVIVCR